MTAILWKMFVMLLLLCGLSACASSHQKNVSFGFGVYQAEYYDNKEGR